MKTNNSKIYTYQWQGINHAGVRVKGCSDSQNLALVKTELRQKSITPLKISKKLSLPSFTATKKIKSYYIVDFSRQIATLTQANIPLVPALQIIANSHENTAMQRLVTAIKKDIETGNTFHNALKNHDKYFDALYCNLIYAGEQSGKLDIMLNQIALYKEKTEILKSKIIKASIYPAAILLTAIIVTAALLVFAVPQFENLFQGYGAELPLYTQIVIRFSKFLQSYGWLLLSGLTGIIFALRWYKRRSPTFAYKFDQLLLKLPWLKHLIVKTIIARFSRTLATTFSAGLPLPESLQIIAGSCGNLVYSQALEQIRNQVIAGQAIHLAMQTSSLFPQRVIQMIAIAEETGELTKMLTKIAEFYEQEVDNAVDGFSKLLEPVIMIILGTLIGGLIAAMYLPIFRIGSMF